MPPAELLALWEAEQLRLLRLQRSFVPPDSWQPIRFVGGLDITFDFADDVTDLPTEDAPTGHADGHSTLCVACLTVLDLSVSPPAQFYQDLARSELRVPYAAGFLAFRELPLYLFLLDRYRSRQPETFAATAFAVDGNGALHPRGFGSACHVGVAAGVRSVGVAKNLFCIPEAGEELTMEHVKGNAVRERLKTKGDRVLLRGRPPTVPSEPPGADSGSFVYGAAVLVSSTSRTPVFVSVGHGMDLDECVDLAVHCGETKVPEMIRRSDIASRAELARLLALRQAGKDVSGELDDVPDGAVPGLPRRLSK
ncbi:endonuclease V-domain-containing protein [Hyaloraphidium curvatum]|nr:endonuclease V-domain-containing protein [Hyaloraphidium curvatum]